MKWLEKGYEERDFRMTLLSVSEEFDGVRSDPRFRELVRRMGLPELISAIENFSSIHRTDITFKFLQVFVDKDHPRHSIGWRKSRFDPRVSVA
jgi:hypothetical protein